MQTQFGKRLAHRNLVPAAAAIAIASWFLYFAHGGLNAGLSSDDLMNLYGYLQKPWPALVTDLLMFWSTAYRPLGALFYVPLYWIFGIDPLPYRVVCFAMLGVNLALLYRFCMRLTNSREIAFIATLLASYHAWFVDLYYSAGTVYDLLCYMLYLCAFLGYIGIRKRGAEPRARGYILIGLLYVLALDAKEMAVTLPLFLFFYELVLETARPRSLRIAWLTGAITLIYVIGKLTGHGSLTENPAYALQISPGKFLDTFHLYMNPLFYREHWFRDSNTVQLLVAMLIVAAWLRSRVLVFAWLWLLLTILPVSFIAHYAAFFEYLPSVGWALYIATLLAMAPARLKVAMQVGLFIFLAIAHTRESPKTLRHFMSVQPPSREIAESFSRLAPTLRRGARVLFVDDPYPADSWFLLYITRLYYRDMTAEPMRAKLQGAEPVDYSGFDAVFGFRGDRLVLMSRLP